MNWRPRHTLVVAAFLACVSNNAARLVVSPVIPNLMDDFGVTKSSVGLALTGMWAVYALLQFPSGLLADRIGEYRVIAASLALTGLVSALLAVAPSFLLFGLFAVCLGAGAGLYFTAGTSLLAKSFERRGAVLGVHSAGGPAAGLIAPPAAAAIAVSYGWRPALLLGTLLSAVALAAFVLRVRPVGTDGGGERSAETGEEGTAAGGTANGGHRTGDPVSAPERRSRSGDADDSDRVSESSANQRPKASGDGADVGAPSPIETVAGFLRRPQVVYMTLLGVALAYTWQSFTSFFPTFLVEYRGLAVGEASLAFGAVFLLSAVSQPAWGRLSDRIADEVVLAAIMLLAASGLSLVVLAGSDAAVLLGVALLGSGLSWGGVFQSRFMTLFSDAERGSAFGLVRTVYMFLGASGSVVTGTLADAVGWSAAYGVVVGLLALGIASLAVDRIRKASR